MPDGKPLLGMNFAKQVIQQCFNSMKEQIKRARSLVKQDLGLAHNATVRFALARDSSQGAPLKFQLIIFLNQDAFQTEPILAGMFAEIERAWVYAVCQPG